MQQICSRRPKIHMCEKGYEEMTEKNNNTVAWPAQTWVEGGRKKVKYKVITMQ